MVPARKQPVKVGVPMLNVSAEDADIREWDNRLLEHVQSDTRMFVGTEGQIGLPALSWDRNLDHNIVHKLEEDLIQSEAQVFMNDQLFKPRWPVNLMEDVWTIHTHWTWQLR